MNKKRFISLAMALVMLVGVFAMAMIAAGATAEPAFDYRTAFIGEAANGYIGAGEAGHDDTEDVPAANKIPDITDGVISENEYSYTRTDLAVRGPSTPTADCVAVKQYVSHDAKWVYLAFEIPEFWTGKKFDLNLHTLQIFDNASASHFDKECVRFTATLEAEATTADLVYYKDNLNGDVMVGEEELHVDGSGFSGENNTNFAGKLTASDVDATSGVGKAVIEAKFSKAALAASAGVEVEDFTSFRYMTKFEKDANRNTRYTGWPVAEGERRNALMASSAALSSVTNDTAIWAVSVNLASYDYSSISSAIELGTTENVAAVLDGVINPEEYSVVVSSTPRYESSGNDRPYEITQYYAYDGDYVYVGLKIPSLYFSQSARNVILRVAPSPVLDNFVSSLTHRSEECIAFYIPGTYTEGTSSSKMQIFYDSASNYRGQEQRSELPLHVDRTVFGEADAIPNATDFDSCIKHTDLPSEGYVAEDISTHDYGVLEFKVSKAKLAESIKLPGGASAGMTADDITTFRFTLQYCDNDGITRLCAPLTDEEMLSGRLSCGILYPPTDDSWCMTGAGRNRWALCVNLSNEAVAPLPTAPATSATTAPPATSAPATSATAAPATSATVAPATSATAAPATSATAAPATSATAAPASSATTAADTTAAATTTAKATAAATTAATTAAEDKGCGGTLTVSALALLPVIAGGAWIVRKKED